MTYKDILLNLTPRGYQESIYQVCKENNCIVVIPTGIGKSLIFLMTAIERLKKYPNSKVLILAPTRPLVQQHLDYFKKNIKEGFANMSLYTGKVKADDRKEIWKTANIIFSTPQCIQFDIQKGLYDLKNTSMLVLDEVHHAVQKYAYVYVTEKYKEQALNQRIIGLTASAGVKKSVVEKIMETLNIDKIEIRTRDSPDVKEYIQELSTNKIYVDLPPKLKEINALLQGIIDVKVLELRAMGLLLGPTNKTVVLDELKKVSAMIRKDPNAGHLYRAMSVLGLIIRCSHSQELCQVQSIHTLNDFIDETYKGKTKGMQNLVKIPEFIKVTEIVKDMLAKGEEHPKMQKILELIQEQQKINPEFKALVFSNYRTTTGALADMLNKNGIPAAQLVGQGKKTTTFGNSGLKQSEQHSVIQDFKSGKIKVLCPTSVGEEGLDLPEINAVIFYEPVPSAIRKIQRCLTKDCKILMSNGEYKTINDIKIGDKVISYNKTKKILQDKDVINMFDNGMKDILEITTEKNNKLKVTKNHPILTSNGWVNAENLKCDDLIGIGHSHNIKSKYSTIFDFLPSETYVCPSQRLKDHIKKNNVYVEDLRKELIKDGVNINKKTFWGGINRDAMTLSTFRLILKKLKLNIDDFKDIGIKSKCGKTINFSKISLSELIWFAGMIASDGDLRIQSSKKVKSHICYRIRTYNTNKKIINKMRNIMEKIGLRVTVSKHDNCDVLECCNTILGKILNNIGIPLTNKTKGIKLSSQLFQSSNEVIEAFLAGYFDGNGSYNKAMCSIRIGTGSQYLAPQLQSLFLRIGINSKLCCEDKTETRIIKGKTVNFTGNFYSVEFYKKIDVVKFLKFKEIIKVSNQIISLDNLRQSKIEKNVFWVKVKEIKKLPPENTYNLEIKDNNTFIVNDIITHNSGRTARLMKGSVYTFLARDTIDEIYYNVAIKKEEKMHKSLETIGHELNRTTQFTKFEKDSQIDSSKWEEVGR